MRERLLDSYKKGVREVYKACKFETVINTESKTVTCGNYQFNIPAGAGVLDVNDSLLGRWLTISRMISENGSIQGEELIAIFAKVATELEEQDGKEN